MCNRIIHKFLINNHITICLYCNKYLSPGYKRIKDNYYCCGKTNIYDNMAVCNNCSRILKYSNILNYLDIYNYKKTNIQQKILYL